MKKSDKECSRFLRVLLKWCIMIKVSWIIILASVLQVSAGTNLTYSQTVRLNLKLKNADLEQVIWSMKEQTRFKFFYSTNDVREVKDLTINVRNATAEEVLDQCLNGTNLTYEIVHDAVIIKELPAAREGELQEPIAPPEKKELKGKVVDDKGEPVPGTSVLVKGTPIGTITDGDGNFTLQAPDDAKILVFSFIGFKPQEVAVSGKTNFEITLLTDVLNLDELVVIGYGTVKKKDLTGSVSSIKSSEIVKVASNNALQSMQGKVAGIDLVKTSGSSGSSVDINLRGNRSINASNSPLFLVDGIEYGSVLDFNASDIESIDVLKDASSTAIYGSRGANGVIIITTKKGLSGGGKTKISFNSYLSFNSPTSVPNKMSVEQEYRLLAEQKRYADEAKTGFWGSTVLSDPRYSPENILSNVVSSPYEKSVYQIYKEGGVNLYDLILRNSVTQNHEVSVSGGDAKTSFNISLGYMDENGLLRNDNLKRYNGKLSIDHKITNRLKVGMNMLYTMRDWNRRDDGLYYYLTSFYALSQPYFADGTLNPYPSELGKSYGNPLFNELPGYYQNNIQSSRLFANTYLEWEIQKGLRFKSVFSFDTYSIRTGIYEDYMTVGHFQRAIGSSFSVNDAQSRGFVNENTLNYTLQLGGINEIQLLAGQSSDFGVSEGRGISGIGLSDHYLKSSFYDLTNIPVTGRLLVNNYVKNTKLSYFGRFNYKLMDRYLLTGTLRGDGASVLAEGHKWAYFPSVAGAWVVSEEPFFKAVEQVDNLKLRLSWGKSGNSAINAYQTLTVLGVDKVPYTFGSDVVYGQIPANLGNEDLSWETTATYDVGMDISLFKSRVSATFDFYRSNTYDLLLYRGLPATSVYPQVLENIGNTQNVGFEAAMNIRVIQQKDFNWSSDLTFSTNKDKILSLASGQTRDVSIPSNALVVGEPVRAFYNYEADGCWKIQEAEQAALYNKVPGMVKIKDRDNNGIINDQDKRLYSKSPKFIIGWSNSFSYKSLSLSATAYARVGQWISYTLNTMFLPTEPGSGPVLDYWTPENQNAKFPRPGIVSSLDLPALAFERASFLKIREIMLSYTVPGKTISRFGLSNLRVYGSLQNYFTLSNIDNYDPEQNGSIYDPLLKQVVFGLNLEF